MKIPKFSLDVTRVTAFVHRVSLQLIALATVAGVVVTQYGSGFGLTTAQIAYIAAGAVSIATILRAISDAVTTQITQVQSALTFWVGEYNKVRQELDTLKQVPQPIPPAPGVGQLTSTPQ